MTATNTNVNPATGQPLATNEAKTPDRIESLVDAAEPAQTQRDAEEFNTPGQILRAAANVHL